MEGEISGEAQLLDACRELRARDTGITVQEVGLLVGGKQLNKVHNLYTVLSHLASGAANDDAV